MIKHIVMWKLADSAAGRKKEENALLLKKKLEALPPLIPEILKLEAGLNFDETENSFDVVLYSEFKSKEALGVYQKHPEHLKLIEFLNKVRLEKRVVNYEVEGYP